MRVSLGCLLLGTALAGCAHYQAEPIDPAQNAGALEARRLDAPQLLDLVASVDPTLGAAAKAGHWSLPSLTLAALYYHPDIAVARARLAEAKAAEETAGELPNPVLSLLPIRHTGIGNPPATVGFAIDILLQLSGARDAGEAQAAALTDAAQQDLATASWQVRGQVQTALLAMAAAKQRQAAAAERSRLQSERATLFERRRAEGAASPEAAGHERTQAARDLLALDGAARDAATARAALAAAIGLPAVALDTVAIATGTPARTPVTEAALRRAALTGRSDVLAALAAYQATEAGLQREVARQYPDISISPGYNYDQQDNQYSIVLGAELPILNQHQGPIAEAEAQRQAAAARLLALQAKIIAELDQDFARLEAADHAAATADALAADETARRDRARRSFESGGTDRPTLVSAELDTVTAELSRIDADAERQAAMAALEATVQQPVFEPGSGLPTPERAVSLMAATP